MKKTLDLIFWGYLLVLLRIDIGIDVLPDPLGYIMIATGCYQLTKTIPVAKKACFIAIVLSFISLPTLIVDVNQVTSTEWVSYAIVLAIINLILVYYLFDLFKAMIQQNESLLRRIDQIFTVYMTLNFAALLHMSFSLNIPEGSFQTSALLLILAILVMDIVFLILINTIKKEVPDDLNNGLS